MMDLPVHSVSVAGVAFDAAGRVLLVKRRDNGQWQAPGGVLELREKFEDGVVREVLEETGLQVRVERLTGVYKNISRSVVALVYRCSVIGGDPTPTKESSEVRWFELADALLLMEPVFAIRVQDATNSPSASPASRAHDGVELL